jgi:hypothetical protein
VGFLGKALLLPIPIGLACSRFLHTALCIYPYIQATISFLFAAVGIVDVVTKLAQYYIISIHTSIFAFVILPRVRQDIMEICNLETKHLTRCQGKVITFWSSRLEPHKIITNFRNRTNGISLPTLYLRGICGKVKCVLTKASKESSLVVKFISEG